MSSEVMAIQHTALAKGGLFPAAVKTKCNLSKPCPANFFAFKICSGAANVVGPTICFEDNM